MANILKIAETTKFYRNDQIDRTDHHFEIEYFLL